MSSKPKCKSGPNNLKGVFGCQSIFIQSLQKAREDLPDTDIRDMLGELQSTIFRLTNISYADKWTILTGALKSCGYEQRLPDAMIIGFKKCGTTITESFLLKHPQFAHPFAMEIHYFDQKNNYNLGLEYYQSQMGFAKNDMLSFEKTPRYVITPDAPINIFKFLPKRIKFVLLLKNPVDRAISDFRFGRFQEKKRGKIQGVQSITQDTEGLLFDQMMIRPDGSVNTDNEIIDTSVYSKHFKNWLDVFPRDKFIIIEHGTLTKNVSHVLKQIERFLGLRPFFQEDMFTGGLHNNICFTLPGERKRCQDGRGFGPIQEIPKPKPSKETLRKLCDFYEPYNQEFEKLTGMTFDWNC